MSLIDQIVAAVTPPESDEARREARAKAMAAAAPGGWFAMVLAQHQDIEAAFVAVREASTVPARMAAQKKLATILTGHSVAEEVVLYPALADANEKAHATKAYTEQSATKMQMGLLERLEPLSKDFAEKLEHIRGAVLHHMYEEEGNWFLDLQKRASAGEHSRLTARYLEEFSRYVGANVQLPGVNKQAAGAEGAGPAETARL